MLNKQQGPLVLDLCAQLDILGELYEVEWVYIHVVAIHILYMMWHSDMTWTVNIETCTTALKWQFTSQIGHGSGSGPGVVSRPTRWSLSLHCCNVCNDHHQQGHSEKPRWKVISNRLFCSPELWQGGGEKFRDSILLDRCCWWVQTRCATAAASPSFPETCAPPVHSSAALQHFSGCGDGGSLRSRTVGLRTSATVQRAALVTGTKQESRVTQWCQLEQWAGEGWCPSQWAAGGGFQSKTCDNNVSKDELPDNNDGSGVGVSRESAGAADLVPDLPLLPKGRGGQGGLPGGAGLPHPHHWLQPKCRLVLFIQGVFFHWFPPISSKYKKVNLRPRF